MSSITPFPSPVIGGKEINLVSVGGGSVLIQAGALHDIQLSDLTDWVEKKWAKGIPTLVPASTKLDFLALTVTTMKTPSGQTEQFTFCAAMSTPLWNSLQLSQLYIHYGSEFSLDVILGLDCKGKNMTLSGSLDKEDTQWAVQVSWDADAASDGT